MDNRGQAARPRGAVRDGLIAAGLELPGPWPRMPSCSARRHRWWAWCPTPPTGTSPTGMSSGRGRRGGDARACRPDGAGVGRVRGKSAIRRGPPAGARSARRTWFARREPGLFATAFALPRQHAYDAPGGGTAGPHAAGSARASSTNWPTPGVLACGAAAPLSTPSGHGHSWPSSPGKGPCANSPTLPAVTSRSSPPPLSARPWHEPARPCRPVPGPPFIEAFLAQTRLGPPNQDRYKARP